MTAASHDRGLDAPEDVEPDIDLQVSCGNCDAVCCRLTVVVMPDDRVPRHLVERGEHGVDTMARGEDGWCAALDPVAMCCGIYEQRPSVCRKFAMGSAYCRDERERYRSHYSIPMQLL